MRLLGSHLAQPLRLTSGFFNDNPHKGDYQCRYTVECIYSDNGREYKGTQEHAFIAMCLSHKINQKFTKPACPQTNGKEERVIPNVDGNVA